MNGSSMANKLGVSTSAGILDSAAPLLVAVLIGYAAADLSVIYLRDPLLPGKAASPSSSARNTTPVTNPEPLASLQTIVSRNIFSMDGGMAEPLSAKGSKDKPGQEADPVPSQLPLGLIGTVVTSDPSKGIADVEIKSKNTVIAVRAGKDIDNLATLIRVERGRIIIRNLNNSVLEYIDGKTSEKKLSFTAGTSGVAPVARGTGEVKQIAPNKFKLSRATINKHTADLGKLVMQASTVPRKKPNGEIDCYILTSFQPDSVFADLGTQQGDCIKTVNGEAITSPAQAMGMYQGLRNANLIKIMVERDGRDVEMEYTIE